MSVVDAGRSAAARLIFHDTCQIKRRTSETLDEETGELAPAYQVLYAVACHVGRMAPEEINAGEERFAASRYTVAVPHTVTDVRPDDVITVTTSRDPFLVDAELVVESIRGDSMAVSRRIIARLRLE